MRYSPQAPAQITTVRQIPMQSLYIRISFHIWKNAVITAPKIYRACFTEVSVIRFPKNLYGTEYDFDGSEEDILKYMRSLMGGSERSEIEYGYYFTIIRNSMPVQSCWCKDERLLYSENEILSQYENGISANLLYSDGTYIGQYPDSGSDEFKYITPSLPVHTALKHIAKNTRLILPPVRWIPPWMTCF